MLRRGRRRASPELVVVTAPRWHKPSDSEDLAPRSEASNRIGITASRKVGNAVVRNRFKRRIREWFRANRGALGRDRDVVVIARRAGARLSLQELDARLRHLLELPPAEANGV